MREGGVFSQRNLKFMPIVGPLTVDNNITTIPAGSIPAGASGLIIQNAVGAGDVHWAIGPTDPSTVRGIVLKAGGDPLILRSAIDALDAAAVTGVAGAVSRIKFVRVTASSGLLSFQPFME